MTKRRVLAAATLATLPAFTAASQSVTPLAAATAPHWGWAWGMEGGEALVFGLAGAVQCTLFGPWGGLACSITGAL